MTEVRVRARAVERMVIKSISPGKLRFKVEEIVLLCLLGNYRSVEERRGVII